MTKFKFFRGIIDNGTIETPHISDTQTFPTASIYNPNTWTPLEQVRERQERIERAQGFSDFSTTLNERLLASNQYMNNGYITNQHYLAERDRLLEEERIRRQRMVEHVNSTNYIPYFGPRVDRPKPNLWMKINMFFENRDTIFGIIIVVFAIFWVAIVIISKILNIW